MAEERLIGTGDEGIKTKTHITARMKKKESHLFQKCSLTGHACCFTV